ncbi:hypothetical protein [Rhodococcus zopfii]|uniref:hypothetical protein n=1 Tax=Rhodococcus zopfii TaxID=43772 RepID=UPI0009325EDB|nr:hypothetical protein [Rhodococcus zopfii]
MNQTDIEKAIRTNRENLAKHAQTLLDLIETIGVPVETSKLAEVITETRGVIDKLAGIVILPNLAELADRAAAGAVDELLINNNPQRAKQLLELAELLDRRHTKSTAVTSGDSHSHYYVTDLGRAALAVENAAKNRESMSFSRR